MMAAMTPKKRNHTRRLVQFSILLALELILGFTPLGLIMVPPVAIVLLHVPVIICGILLGPLWGGGLGFAFGMISMYKATTAAVLPLDMAFSPFVSGKPLASLTLLAPRILIGVFAAFLFKLLSARIKNKAAPIIAASVAATVLHTVTVIGIFVLFFPELGYTAMTIIAAVFALNCGLEILAAVALATPVCLALLRAFRSAV